MLLFSRQLLCCYFLHNSIHDFSIIQVYRNNFIQMGFHLDFLVGKQEKLNLFVRNLYVYHRKVKKQKSLRHIWIFVTPMDYTVHGILQARMLE